MLEDSHLITAYLNGDSQAFEELYNRYRRQIYSYLNRLCGADTQLADDLFQQTWVKAIQSLQKYSDRGKFLPWLLRIAHNNFISHTRRAQAAYEIHEEESVTAVSPLSTLDNSELYHHFKLAMAQLPIEQREVFSMRQEELSFKEIAKIQKVSINTVLGQMRYATDRLRKLLEHLI